jgi:hypothetical protein
MPARTWTLATTLSNAINQRGVKTHAPDGQDIYFIDSTGQLVIELDNSLAETDISGTTFTGAGVEVAGLAILNGSLYCLYVFNGDGECKIARYAGGQTWTDLWTVDDGSDPGLISPGSSEIFLDSDNDRLVCVAEFDGIVKLAASEDGENWTIQTVEGSEDNSVNFFVYGRNYGLQYGSILCRATYVDGNSAIEYAGGDNWTLLLPSGDDEGVFCGYLGGYSLHAVIDGINRVIKKSLDWGGTTLDAGGVISPGHGAPPLFIPGKVPFSASTKEGASRGSTAAYSWNRQFSSNEFVADGTTGSGIYGFFVLNSTLYAFCNNGEIYAGGAAGWALSHSSGGMPGSVI